MIENEVKIKITPSKFEELILKLGKSKFHNQKNTFYLLHEGFLRLRVEDKDLVLTFKGKNIEAKFKACEEIEIKLNNSLEKIVIKLLEKIGLKLLFSYSKKRASYYFENCVVCLDILENGNRYLEIEGSDEAIQEKMNFFNLIEEDIEHKSYFEMLRGDMYGN